MGVVIGLAVLLLGGGYFAKQTSQLSRSAWAGPRTQAQKQRGPAKPRTLRQELRLIKARAQSADWLEQRRHERKAGTGRAAVNASPPAVTGAVLPPLQRAQAAARARFTRPGGGGAPPAAPAAPPGAAGAPRPAPSPASSPNGSPGRTTTVAASSTGSAEKLIDGANQIHAEASAGNIHAKHGATKAFIEGSLRLSQTSQMMGRAMSERNYGPEITEPYAKAAEHFQAAAMALGESDTALTTLLAMTVGEAADSPRQVPHHTELTESR